MAQWLPAYFDPRSLCDKSIELLFLTAYQLIGMDTLMPSQLQHESKTKLLNAALNVIRAKGYAATTVDDICHAAGVTKGSFFHHFKSKDDLALSAAAYWGEMTEGFFASAPYQQSKDPLRTACSATSIFAARFCSGDLPDYTCLLGTLVQETYATHPDIRAACDKGMSTHIAILRATSKPRSGFTRPTRPGARKASAISSNRFCRARSSSPRRSKAPRSRANVSRICGAILGFSSTSRGSQAKGKVMTGSNMKKFLALYLVPSISDGGLGEDRPGN